VSVERAECDQCGAWVLRGTWLGMKITLERFGLPFADAEVLEAYGGPVWRIRTTVKGYVSEPWDGHDRRSHLTLVHECKRKVWGRRLVADRGREGYEQRAARHTEQRRDEESDADTPPY
jgi:predicted Rdx family selenoprotein